jgi:predicted nucleotidyltransferase
MEIKTFLDIIYNINMELLSNIYIAIKMNNIDDGLLGIEIFKILEIIINEIVFTLENVCLIICAYVLTREVLKFQEKKIKEKEKKEEEDKIKKENAKNFPMFYKQ